MPNGLLLIDKPVGLRSAECVARVKKHFAGARVGHAGTLDSTASGLLIVLLGLATRLSDYVMKLSKVYEAEVCLGVSTDTCDSSGQVVFRGDAAKVDEAAFDSVLRSFWGERMQLPPGISALKVGGKPSHRIVRSGGAERPKARPVYVTSVKRCSPLREGRVRISVTCGKGTYIRSIVRDIGEILQCGACVTELRRLSTGPFHVRDALLPDATEEMELRLRSPAEVGAHFHRVSLSPDAERRLMDGLCVPLGEAGRYVPGSVSLSGGVYVEGKRMIGFADIETGAKGELCLRPKTNIIAGPEELR
ncbi:MAG: tRNA pseudouridine(55) synthase TruB [Synergistaceae bacterium]|jgi:tRNA pseudouridine(55) synthase|nr:tRNA pseudouridine(55) synthase TruB [Synergistaceae bacterium]